MPTPTVPVSLVVPTVGRMQLLIQLLESVAAGDHLPAETILVDQSGGPSVAELPERFPSLTLRVVASNGRHPGLARNEGWRLAEHDTVLGTDDDCIVAPDWVGKAWRHMVERPTGLVTGRVLPKGDAVGVPSVKDEPRRSASQVRVPKESLSQRKGAGDGAFFVRPCRRHAGGSAT